MRHLSLLETLPTKQELRARIPNPERFQPEPQLLSSPQIRILDDGTGEILLPRTGKWRHIHAMHVATAQALGEGCTFEQAVERAKGPCPPRHLAYCEKLVRRFVWQLHQGGLVDIPLAPPPPTFAERYVHVKELGRGGMGIVHLCRDTQRDDALVVVKHAWGWSKPIERAELSVREEARALSHFDHPRIPGLVDVFERDGLLHMVRGFAPGEPLNELVPHASELESLVRLDLLRGCAEALAHVHERGFLYLDVKPDNFIIRTIEEGPSLLDFGVCRALGADARVQLRGGIGSPGFAAPEVVGDYVATPASDVYSLGRSFATLATRQKFKYRHKQADVATALLEANVPEAERDLIVRMCAEDPLERPATMHEVIAAIA